MLASTIARWIVAVQFAAAAFVGAFLLTARTGQALHASQPVLIGAADGIATIVAAVVGLLIVPASTRSSARYVFGGIPVAVGILALFGGLAGHTPTPANFAGLLGSLLAGYVVLKAFSRPHAAPA